MKRFYLGAFAFVGLVSVLVVAPLMGAPELRAQGDGPQYVCKDDCEDPSPWVDTVGVIQISVSPACHLEFQYRTRRCGSDFDFEIRSIRPLEPSCSLVPINHNMMINQAALNILTNPVLPVPPGFRPPPGQCRDIRGYTSNCWSTIVSPLPAIIQPCTEHCCYKNWELCSTPSGTYVPTPSVGASNSPLACPAEPGSSCALSYNCSGQFTP